MHKPSKIFGKVFTFYWFTVLILVSPSCKKEISSGKVGHSPDCDEVFDMTIDEPIGVVYFTEDSVQFKYPTINPNNSDEILYHYINYNTFTFQLKKYNIKTGLNQLLVDNVMLVNAPSWSKSGKIVFEVQGNELFLTDEFGTDPISFGPNGLNRKPSWLGDSDIIIFRNENPLTGELNLLAASSNGENVDTLIPYGPGNFIISQNNMFLASSGDNYYSMDLTDFELYTNVDLTPIPFSMEGGEALGMCWSSDGTKFFIAKHTGLYEVNFPSGTYKRIIKYCSSKAYTDISASPNGKLLIVQRVDSYQKFNSNGGFTGEIVQNSSIYTFNPETGMEMKLDLE